MSDLSKYIDQSDVVHQKTKLLDGRSIGITGWKVKQENALLYAIETSADNDEDSVITHCIDLARKCVDDIELFNTLPRNTLLHLISQIRKMSKGGEIEMTFMCTNPDCPTFVKHDEATVARTNILGMGSVPFETVIDIDQDIEIQEFNKEPIVTDKFTFVIEECSYPIQQGLEKLYLHEEGKISVSKFNYEMLLACIKEVIPIEGEPIIDFNIEELRAVMDDMEPKVMEKIGKEFAEHLSDYKITKKAICPQCQDPTDLTYDNVFGMLVF